MRAHGPLVVVVLLLLSCAASSGFAAPTNACQGLYRIQGTVTSIVDGTTMMIVNDGTPKISSRIHLLGVVPVQRYESEAVAYLSRFVVGRHVFADIRQSNSTGDPDQSPGTLEWHIVCIDDEIPSLAEAMLQAGVVVVDRSDGYPFADYVAAEESARRSRHGLWRDDGGLGRWWFTNADRVIRIGWISVGYALVSALVVLAIIGGATRWREARKRAERARLAATRKSNEGYSTGSTGPHNVYGGHYVPPSEDPGAGGSYQGN